MSTRNPRYHLGDKVLVSELTLDGPAYRECKIAQEPKKLPFDGKYQLLCDYFQPKTGNKLETYGETELFTEGFLPPGSNKLVDEYSIRKEGMLSHEDKRMAQLMQAERVWEEKGKEQTGTFFSTLSRAPHVGASRRKYRRRRQNKNKSRRRYTRRR